jgi:hypothetical protein
MLPECAHGAHWRIVIPGFPHHATQRVNRRQPNFFEPGDEAVYRKFGRRRFSESRQAS